MSLFSIKNFFLLILFFILIGYQNEIVAKNNVKIVLKIEDNIITNIDIEKEYNYLSALNNELKKIDKKNAIEIAKKSIVRETIKFNELKKYYNFEQNPNISDEYIKNFYKRLNLNNEDEFNNYLNQYDLNIKDIKKKINIEILWNNLIGEKYKYQINVDEDKLKKRIKDQKLDKVSEKEYNLLEIVFNAKDEQDLKNKVKEIKKNIEINGFKNTANKFSISESSKFGGEIGWLRESQLSEQITENIKSLKKGETSKLIKLSGGFMILKLNNLRLNENTLNFDKVLEELILFEKNKQYNQYSVLYFNKLKNSTFISEQ